MWSRLQFVDLSNERDNYDPRPQEEVYFPELRMHPRAVLMQEVILPQSYSLRPTAKCGPSLPPRDLMNAGRGAILQFHLTLKEVQVYFQLSCPWAHIWPSSNPFWSKSYCPLYAVPKETGAQKKNKWRRKGTSGPGQTGHYQGPGPMGQLSLAAWMLKPQL